MATSKCSVENCKRDFDTLCGHCQTNVCSKHYIEHVKLANDQLVPLADRLNCIINDIQQGNPLQQVFQQLEEWRKQSHKQIDKICDEKKQQLQLEVLSRTEKQMKKLQEIRQEVKELIDEGDASFKQIEKITNTIIGCQQRYEKFSKADFVRMKLKPIEIMINIIGDQSFSGGSLLTQEYQIKLNEFYGKADQEWILIYKATRDGFRGSDFHRCCDSQGSTITVIQSKNGGYLFGGYTSLSWRSLGNYVQDNNGPFIFTLTNPHGIPPTKYNINTQFIQYSICDNNTRGPIFGGGNDLHVCDNSHTQTYSYTKFPHSYIDTTNRGNATFTGSKNFQTSEIEVYRLAQN